VPENAPKLIEKAESRLRNAYMHLHKLSRAYNSQGTAAWRTEAHGVLTSILQSLALLNRTYFTKGFGKNREQILQMPLRPTLLESHMDTIMRSGMAADVILACELLTADTLELVLAQKEKHAGAHSYPDRMKGFYEEEKGVLDKIITACETNDYDTAFFFAIHAQEEIARFLYFAEKGQWPSELEPCLSYQEIYQRVGLPDLAVLLNPHDLAPLQAAVERLSTLLLAHLTSQGVEINHFHTVEQFEAFLAARG
jgi:hypothetical protein